MKELLDEETLAIVSDSQGVNADLGSVSARLNNVNALKNHARYSIAQQNGQLFENSILKAGSELLSLTISVKRMQCPTDMFAFRSGIKNALTDLKYKVAKLDYPPSVADKACFLFAVMLDEQILHSSWGESSGWENQTIVSELFGIKNGGEQFYVVAERALLQPVLLVDLLELIYIMLKMGFRGRYRANGKDQLDALMKRIEESVFAQGRSFSESERLPLLVSDIAEYPKVIKPKKPVRLWRSFASFLFLVGATWLGAYYWYDITLPQKAQPFIQLADYTEPYYGQASDQDTEYVYYSTAEEMQTAQISFSNQTNAHVTGVSSPQTVWIVQLATFNTIGDAQRFVSQYKRDLPNASIDAWKGKFRVISESGTKILAARRLNAARAAGISDAFMLNGKQ
ncbi:type IVB secretion system protein IcmH/DotU [Marinomonas mediterranea]|jgi:type IV / VI secretion system protein, DotU family|uniref:Type IV / VI secretion system protein, DotU family n=1 Tax=Marinomonas mediterranea (strain ATCC 700492 / JCM 21426 / NBRC 103028 / MMB-1) TaxID=717774 RepID=F2K2M2_MARM1|nr:type IVB secretion system protein IcmH/DotU [Marinomonas mediterranea]ADZ90067.1 type IV / VI secretion system protein, DotU family [Marinomonas mediterranea MMB-1]WCN16272.1 type IV secretion protein DotU [Marinomonas mediterranea MMB-1]